MIEFQPYVTHLESLLLTPQRGAKRNAVDDISRALGEGAAAALFQSVSPDKLRRNGAFFTAPELARRALEPIHASISATSLVVDPACGAGDLLLACTGFLPTSRSASSTLDLWGRRVGGRDLQPSFVRATGLRLALAASKRSTRQDIDPADIAAMLPDVSVGSGLTSTELVNRATHLVLNPPFTHSRTPDSCSWASGRVSTAALFLAECVEQARVGTHVIAILPDVLRSGERYKRWRAFVDSRIDIESIQLDERFGRRADVHTFVLRGKVRRAHFASSRWPSLQAEATATLGEVASIKVGPVVDYRAPHTGPWRPFLRANGLPRWSVFEPKSPMRRFSGRVFTPPFVVVRRTSRPEDEHRAVATIVAGAQPVAVENHLIVIEPLRGTLRECTTIMRRLRDPRTSEWLNLRIRCRHLTTAALSNLPWWSER